MCRERSDIPLAIPLRGLLVSVSLSCLAAALCAGSKQAVSVFRVRVIPDAGTTKWDEMDDSYPSGLGKAPTRSASCCFGFICLRQRSLRQE